MKKIISILIASSFLACSAYAGGMIGVKLGHGELDGKRTVDPSHGIASKAEGSVSNEYGAVFAEFSLSDMFSVGVELVPFDAIIDTEADGTDSHATVSDFTTLYALISVPDSPIYAKLGYGHADLAVKANYDSVTVGSHSDALEGHMIGVGAQFESPLPFLDIFRVEANIYEFDEINITTTNTTGTAQTTTKKGEAELMTLSLSIAKSF